MFRLIFIVLVSFCSLFPLLAITTQQFGLSDNAGAVVSVIIGWLILPTIILNLWREKPGLEVLPVDIDDPIMKQYITISKSKIDKFYIALFEGVSEAYIKFPYEFEGEVEHVWGLAHTERDDLVIISLASEPVGEMDEDVMCRIKVPKNDIEDWMLVDGKGNTQGGYTILAMAKIYERDHGKLPKRYVRDLERFTDFSWIENA